jgi:DegV family protein with EDD domain
MLVAHQLGDEGGAMRGHTNDIAIITDSTCDIPADLMEKYHITVVPLYVLWGADELRDGVDINNPTFYARLPKAPVHPKTSQPTPADFVRPIQESGAEEVVIITISKELSGTFDSAHGAQEMVDMPVHVVDSFSLSMGLGWQVLAAARVREEGGDVEAMIAEAQRVRERLSLLLTVDTLEYLHRGGRIGGAAKLLGSVIQLKPLLGINHATGTLEAVESIRTRAKALRRLVEVTFERVDPARPMRAAVIHAASPDDAQRLLEEVRTRYDPIELISNQITPVLGVHGGPGLVGICAYNE